MVALVDAFATARRHARKDRTAKNFMATIRRVVKNEKCEVG